MSDAYDLAGARKAGISDEDSLNHLASVNGYDLAGARAAGIPDSDSLNHLMTVRAAPEPVVEKESPEALGGIGATVGAVGAAGDVIYSKGRPLFRMAEKAMGMDSGAPTVKPRTFQDPATVAEQAIARRTAPAPDVTGSPSAVKNWGATQHEGEFLGGAEYKDADRIKKEALAFEKQNPTQKVLPGSLLAVPEEEAKRLAQQRAELAAQQDIAKQAEVQKVAQTRAERLGERAELKGKSNQFGAAKGAGNIAVKVGAPVLGGYELGSQGAQAYNRLTRPDLTASDVAAGATNVVGATTGALSMVPSKYRIPAAIISQGAGAIANFLDKRNPRKEEVEQKAQGGLAGYAEGGGPKLPGKLGKFQKVAENLGTALKPLARAPAKSKAEIEAIAQRMAPQELGEFVRAPGKTTSVSGASKKQYDRELGLQHDIRNVIGTENLPEIDYHKRIGDVAMMLPGDKSIVGDIHRVGDLELEKVVRAEGGKGFPVNYALENPDLPPELWTSTGQVAKNYQNLGRKVAQEYGAENVLPHYANMPLGMGYSQHFADTLLRGLRPAGADLGKATDMMRTGSFKGKTFPDFPGFENMDEVYELMKHNPEMRQLFTNRIQVQDVAKSLGLPPTYGSDALHAVTSPSLRNLETGAGGHLIGRLDLGRQMSPSTHSGYIPYRDPGLNIPGEAIARTSNATPYEMLYPDLLNDIRTNPITYSSATGKQMIVPEFGRLKMDSPRQIIDPQFADEMAMYKEAMKKLTGKAAGGSINMDELQARKNALPDISLSARDLPNMTGQPGVGYMQTPQGAMARLQLEKELEKARLRAGVSGLALAIPGQQGIKTIPGQMDIGAKIPLGRGNLDISARRSINPVPGRGYDQGINAQYSMKFAEGGEVKHFEGGGKTGALLSLLKPAVNRIDMHFKDVIKRTPQITEAARLLKEGKLSREEFDRIVNQFKPVTPYNFVPQPATEAEAMDALGKKGIGKFKLALPEGHPVDLRLDIPAYKDKGVWVNSIHNAGQKNVIPDTSYSNVAAARDVGFEITPRNQERFLNYAADLEGQNKFTGARMQGLWTPMDDKDFIEKSQDALRSKDWTQIGMDPERHGYFYDRTSMEPIAKADEVLQVGPLVLGKNPKYGKKKDSLYAQGGLVDNYAPGGRIVKGALDALNKASEGKLGQVANKDLTTLQDYHTSLGDRVAAGAKEMQDKIAAAQFKYKKGDRVFTDWTAKNNYPPYEILGTRILGGKFGTILRDPATGKALRDENGKALREAEHVGYQVRHDFTPHGETEPSWRIHTMPETSFKGLIEPEEPYKKGGKVKKK
jgi:hypothetical protein